MYSDKRKSKQAIQNASLALTYLILNKLEVAVLPKINFKTKSRTNEHTKNPREIQKRVRLTVLVGVGVWLHLDLKASVFT